MSRRPSNVSVSSAASTSTLPKLPITLSQTSIPHGFKPPSSPWPPRSSSFSSISQQNIAGNVSDPDELFTKHTVSEVKAIQYRLRYGGFLADADAKQEELRLMVGERYRDLLQASTSIISISKSSKRVLDALDEVRSSIPDGQPEPKTLKRASAAKDDSYLKMLQSLASHMKLLLDTPEHLWRLIEKKKYLHAAWLFLLARVIHRVLVREDDEDEEGWAAQGIDVTEQFPLAQRQWDTVAQFRAQITHKATLSLREFSSSVEDICSILLTLHLLESRPLIDTLSVFLSQRTKSFQLSLSRNSTSNGRPPQQNNGSAKTKSRQLVVRELRGSIGAVLDVISFTVGAARDIFYDEPSSSRRCLIHRVLEFIQSESQDTETLDLPPELQMSTQNLLTNLPSGSQHLSLPQSIRSYRPYIDLSSSSTSISASQLSTKLHEWFEKVTKEFATVAQQWFSDLQTLKEVWSTRAWIRTWLEGNAYLEDAERESLKSIADGLVRQQASEIWKVALADMQQTFQSHLDSAMSALAEGTGESVLDASPVSYLFQAPAVPSLYETSGSSGMAASFRKYEMSLHRQVAGRTPLLNDVLESVETRSAAIRKDLRAFSKKSEADSRELADQLISAYQPDADQLCVSIAEAVSTSVQQVGDDSDISMRALVFLGRVANELSSSPFLPNISSGTDAGHDFRARMRGLYELALDRWRRYSVRTISLKYHESCLSAARAVRTPSAAPSPAGPSAPLFQALLSISTSVQNVGMSSDPSSRTTLAEATLRHFTSSVLEGSAGSDAYRRGQQFLWDLRYLHKISALWGSDWESTTTSLKEEIDRSEAETAESTSLSEDAINVALSNHISRTQLLLAPLLPPRPPPTHPGKAGGKESATSALLPFGVPAGEQQVQPAMELVKPAPRFGLLLVGSTASR
ncbi:uncharacterized protein STEHIDRAFT_89072 [Stereum hirsutum FP-91666 SS1]|uniref:uncharacterized protein n=1 Tax=Stereum hirsutum (strain FP-91666) TaxID=721885 RepID=UPI000440CE94|nr:uncharacterized protein STEHIDRAFT_89072 [Stereum hirsutum FP-91666 SS1]EIM92224.1 hypothetical protein STEHIDRAFT_89072 [Stereum hirsutum FP-91666 SS1]